MSHKTYHCQEHVNSSDDADLKGKEKYLLALNCILAILRRELFAEANLYMAILRTGGTFYHREIAQQQFYSQPRNSSQIAMRGQMGPKWGECYKCGMVIGWFDGRLM